MLSILKKSKYSEKDKGQIGCRDWSLSYRRIDGHLKHRPIRVLGGGLNSSEKSFVRILVLLVAHNVVNVWSFFDSSSRKS